MVPARVVADAIRERLPDVDDEKLHNLLYYCQGWHLAHTGQPLFPEEIHAVEPGGTSPIGDTNRGSHDHG